MCKIFVQAQSCAGEAIIELRDNEGCNLQATQQRSNFFIFENGFQIPVGIPEIIETEHRKSIAGSIDAGNNQLKILQDKSREIEHSQLKLQCVQVLFFFGRDEDESLFGHFIHPETQRIGCCSTLSGCTHFAAGQHTAVGCALLRLATLFQQGQHIFGHGTHATFGIFLQQVGKRQFKLIARARLTNAQGFEEKEPGHERTERIFARDIIDISKHISISALIESHVSAFVNRILLGEHLHFGVHIIRICQHLCIHRIAEFADDAVTENLRFGSLIEANVQHI